MLYRFARHRFPALVVLGIFLVAFIPRAWALDVFITIDETRWIPRSMNFLLALLSGDWASTFRVGHPGVTTMLCVSLGAAIHHLGWVAGISPPAAGWPGDLISTAQLIPTDVAGSLTPLRLPIALVTSIGVVGMYLLSSRLFGHRVAVVGAILVALEPFFVAHSRFLHTDALLSTFMTLSILSLAAWLGEHRWRFLFLSGIAAGLALLTKSTALLLLPAAFLTVLIHSREDLREAILPVILWGLAVAATFFALWPAMWVDPLGTVMAVWLKAVAESEGGHLIYFLGNISMDPGPGFYPLVLLARATPLTLIGAVLAAITVIRGRQNTNRGTIGFLAAYILGFALFAAAIDKKQGRYLLPIFPILGFLAAVGWVSAIRWTLEEITRRRQWKWPLSRTVLFGSAAGIILLLQAISSLPTAPYYLTYYSPAVGGPKGAKELIQIGWGEGMNLAAAYLNSLPGSAHQRVAASYSETFQPFFHGETIAPNALLEADHVVLYLSEVQRNRPSAWAVSLLSSQEPEHVVRLGGIEYAWVYSCSNLPIYASPPVMQYSVQIPLLDSDGERKITLLGYDLDRDSVPSGNSTTIDLYWQCNQPPGAYYNLSLQLVNAVMRSWGGVDEPPVSGRPATLLWEQGLILRDDHTFQILPGTPPGSYRLLVSLYNPYSGSSLRPPDEEPLFLKAIEVEANPELTRADLGIQHHSDARLGDDIRFLGYNVEETAKPGDTLHLTLFWEAMAEVSGDYTVFTHLIDEANNIWGQHDGQPADGFSPTSKWTPGILLRDPHDLTLPANIPPGSYQIEVGLYLADTGERLPIANEQGAILGDRITLGPIQVEAP